MGLRRACAHRIVIKGWGSEATPAHDARGNMTTVPKPDSPASAFTCVYDAWNRLVQVKDADTVVGTYRYDGTGRRIQKLLGPDAEVPDTAYDYYYSGSQVVEVRKEVKSRASEPALATLLYEQYVWSARYIDAPVLRDRDADGDSGTGDYGKTGSGLEERLYYTTDANMNVTATFAPPSAAGFAATGAPKTYARFFRINRARRAS